MAKVKKKILCFGSYNEDDDLAFRIYDLLKKDKICDDIAKSQNPFDLANFVDEGNLVIIDVVRGLDKTKIFRNMKEFEDAHTLTVHDLDAGFMLKILEHSRNRNFKIIGVPYGANVEDVIDDVKHLISSA
jgi:carbamoylphosphate synthase small subunit